MGVNQQQPSTEMEQSALQGSRQVGVTCDFRGGYHDTRQAYSEPQRASRPRVPNPSASPASRCLRDEGRRKTGPMLARKPTPPPALPPAQKTKAHPNLQTS